MKNIIFKIAMITFALVLSSCEKEITIDLPEYESKVVFEGTIEIDEYSQVVITKSADYFSVYNQQTLESMFVNNAFVTVTNQNNVVDTLDLTIDMNMPFPFVYKGKSIKGQVGGVYTLNAIIDGKTYSSTTRIPQPVAIDSAFYFEMDEINKSGIIRLKFTDPAGINNFYRVFTKRVNKDSTFYAVMGATYDDKFFDGNFTFGDLYRGDISNLKPVEEEENTFENNRYYNEGDTVIIKQSSLDFNSYKFWYSAEQLLQNGQNPFMSPASVKSNIADALGVWCGYGSTYYTVILKK